MREPACVFLFNLPQVKSYSILNGSQFGILTHNLYECIWRCLIVGARHKKKRFFPFLFSLSCNSATKALKYQQWMHVRGAQLSQGYQKVGNNVCKLTFGSFPPCTGVCSL